MRMPMLVFIEADDWRLPDHLAQLGPHQNLVRRGLARKCLLTAIGDRNRVRFEQRDNCALLFAREAEGHCLRCRTLVMGHEPVVDVLGVLGAVRPVLGFTSVELRCPASELSDVGEANRHRDGHLGHEPLAGELCKGCFVAVAVGLGHGEGRHSCACRRKAWRFASRVGQPRSSLA